MKEPMDTEVKQRPVVFLDIDGVIATKSSYRKAGELRDERPEALLDKQCVRRLQDFVDWIDGDIVLISAWRDMYPMEFFHEHVSFRIVGMTKPDHELPAMRHEQVSDWMSEHDVSADRIVILEDENDMGPLRSRWVRTNFNGPNQGFSRKHLRRALYTLGYADADKISREIG